MTHLPIFYAYLFSSFTYILCINVDIGTGCIVSSGDNSESKCIHVTALDDENALLEDDDDLCLYRRTLDLDEGNIDQFIECVQCRYTSIPLYTSHSISNLDLTELDLPLALTPALTLTSTLSIPDMKRETMRVPYYCVRRL